MAGRRSRLIHGTLIASVGLFGVLAGWQLNEMRRAPDTPKTRGAAMETPKGEQGEGLTAAERRDLVHLIRAELATAPREVQCESEGRGAGGLVPSNEPDPVRRQEIFVSALRIVDRARAAGTWSEDDKEELRRVGPSLTPEQRREITSELLMAINSQEIRMTKGGLLR